MACFTVSAIGALGVGVIRHVVKKKEAKKEHKIDKFGSDIKWSKKLAYLELVLAGGSLLLLGEHIIHGEITFYPPFLTAMSSKEDTIIMLKEVASVGVLMFLLLVFAWACGIFIFDLIKYRKRMAKNIIDKEV